MAEESYLDGMKKTKSQKKPIAASSSDTVKPRTRRRHAEPTVPLAVRISAEQSNQFNELCDLNGWTKTYAVTEALRLLHKNQNG